MKALRFLAAAAVIAGCGGAAAPVSPAAGARHHALYAEGKFAAAEQELLGVVARDPRDMLARRLLGRVLLMRNDVKGAARHLGEAVRLSTDAQGLQDPMALNDYAAALHRADDYDSLARCYFILGNAMLANKYREMAKIRPPYTTAWRGESASIGFLERGTLPVVQATVNGIVGAFIIDTSEGEIVLDNDYAKLARARTVGAAGVAVNEGFVDEVSIPGLVVKNVPVQMRNFKKLGGREIHGVLGLSFLLHFNVTIDFRRERVTLRPTGSAEAARGETVPFLVAGDGLLIAAATVDGRETHLAVHLGLAGKAFVPSHRILDSRTEPIREVRVGPLKPAPSDDPKLFPPGVDSTYGFTIGGMLGIEAFRGRCVTLDVDRMRLVID